MENLEKKIQESKQPPPPAAAPTTMLFVASGGLVPVKCVKYSEKKSFKLLKICIRIEDGGGVDGATEEEKVPRLW